MTNQDTRVSVLIVDDHRLFREGLRSTLEACDFISAVYEAGNGRDAIHKAAETTPDVVLMDISLPDLNGMEATRQIAAAHPKINILGLTMHIDKAYVMGMMKAGARGFLTKTCSARDLRQAIRKVADCQTYICEEVMGGIADSAIQPENNTTAVSGELTPREAEILKRVADGATNPEISGTLNISVRTVEKHRQNIMDKLGIRTVAQLTKYAIRKGYTLLN